MVIAKTPLRISFFGGGSDYPEALPRLPGGGATIGCGIDQYTYVTVNRGSALNDYRFRVSYSRIEFGETCDDIQHPAVRECLRFLDFTDPVEIYVITDLPSRTGLGSSSSFTVCLLHALHALRGELVPPERLAAEAVYVERELIQERVGLQDQYLCALGGMQWLRFVGGTDVTHEPVPLSAARLNLLQEHLLLFYTGMRRTAHEVLDQQLANTGEGRLDTQLQQMTEMVEPACRLLCGEEPLDSFGEMLHESWKLKRSLSNKISNEVIDEAYRLARQAGAIGGKLLGAGGGGFLLLYVPPRSHMEVGRALPGFRQVPIRLGARGSHLVFAER